MRFLILVLMVLFALPANAGELNTVRPQAPQFSLQMLNGETFQFSSTKGKVVVVSFWASWCKPCIQELGFLKTLQAQHPDKLAVLAIATDDPNTISKVRMIVKRKKLTMPVLLDQDGTVMGLLNSRGSLPFSVYIDKQGNIASTHDGFSSGDEEKLEATVKTLLAEGTAAAPKAQPTPVTGAAPKAQPASATPTTK